MISTKETILGILWIYLIVGYMAEVMLEIKSPTWYVGTTAFLTLIGIMLLPYAYIAFKITKENKDD